MKQIACSQMGGPADCQTIITGNTPEEMVDNGMKHVMQAHPQQASDIQKMSKDETTKWMTDFRAKFDSLPEM